MMIRQRKPGFYDIGVFLIDQGCLGVKDAMFDTVDEFELAEYREHYFNFDFEERDGAWGRKFVEKAVAYAKKFGFKPHRDYKKASRVFGGIKSSDCQETFTFGHEGKPFYVQGSAESNQQANRIIQLLRAHCGEDGFHFLLATEEEEDLEEEVDVFLTQAEQGDHELAETGLARLQELHPDSAVVHFGMGTALCMKDAFEEALPHFDRALAIRPDYVEAWNNKANIHQKLEEIFPMTEAYQKVLQCADPGKHQDLIEAARYAIDLVTKMVREDLDTFLKAARIFEKAWGKIDSQQWEEAIALLDQAIQLNPKSSPAYANKGLCLIKLNCYQEAREAVHKALELDPNYEIAHANLKFLDSLEVEHMD